MWVMVDGDFRVKAKRESSFSGLGIREKVGVRM